MVKNPPANKWVQSLVWEDPLKEGTATHSSILAWRIPWTEKPGGATVHGVAKSQTRLSDRTELMKKSVTSVMCVLFKPLSHVQFFAIHWAAARQTPLSMEFSRQKYWSGLLCPPPGGSSQLRDQTQVSLIADRFFTV